MADPAAAASPITPLFDPERFHSVLFDQRGAGRSRRKAVASTNTLPHLIADMEMIREKFGITRWMIAAAPGARRWRWPMRKRTRPRHGHRVRATFLGTRSELEGAFIDVLPRFYPDLSDISQVVAAGGARAAIDAYWRRILDSAPPCARSCRPRLGDTERILSDMFRGVSGSILNSQELHRALLSTPFMEAHYFQNDCFMKPGQAAAEPAGCRESPVSSCRALRSASVRPHSHAFARCGPDRRFVSSKAPATRCTIPASGYRDEGDRGSGLPNYQIEDFRKCRWPEKECC